MPSDTPSAGDMDALSKRIAALDQRFEELQSANASARATGRIVAAVVAIAAIFGVTRLILTFRGAYENRQAYSEALMGEYRERIQPALTRELDSILKETAPRLGKLVVTAVENRKTEIIGVAEHEVTTFIENTKKFGETELTTRQDRVRKEVEAVLEREVPELKDPEKREAVLGNLAVILETTVKRVIDENLQPHLNHIADLELALRQFPIPAHIEKKNSAELSQHLTDLMMEYTTYSLRNSIGPRLREFTPAEKK